MKPTLVIAIPALRNMLLLWNVKGLDNEHAVRVFLDHSCNVGDWFVLYQLSKNTDKVFFSQLLPVIVEECHKKNGIYPSSQLEKSKHVVSQPCCCATNVQAAFVLGVAISEDAK